MNRYLTRWYATTSHDEAVRLMALDHTPAAELRVTHDVEPVHVATQGWVYWSDGRFTTSTGSNLPRGGSLSRDAVQLISLVRGSDGGHVDGGVQRLVRVADIIATETVELGEHRGHYRRPTIEKLTVRWADGSEGTLYTYSEGYFEGYSYDIYDSPESLQKAIDSWAETLQQLAVE